MARKLINEEDKRKKNYSEIGKNGSKNKKDNETKNSLDDKADTPVESFVGIQAISSNIAYAKHDHIVPTLEDNRHPET